MAQFSRLVGAQNRPVRRGDFVQMFGPTMSPRTDGRVWVAASGSANQIPLRVVSLSVVQEVQNNASSYSSDQQREPLTVSETPDSYISPESDTCFWCPSRCIALLHC